MTSTQEGANKMDYTNYRISHKTMNAALPTETDIDRNDWAAFVARTDAMDMNRSKCSTRGYKDGASNHYEGQWLKQWVDCHRGENLTKTELRMAPLFTDLTTPLDALEARFSDHDYAKVRWQDVATCSADGQPDPRALAKRIAETSLENRDGETELVHLRAVTDAWDALTVEEQKAIPSFLEQNFARDVTVKYAHCGIDLAFDFTETPVFAVPVEHMKRSLERSYDHHYSGGPFKVDLNQKKFGGREIQKEDATKAAYWFKSSRGTLSVDAPAGSRVVIRALGDDGCTLGDFLAKQDVPAPKAYLAMATGVESGKVKFDLSDLPENASSLAVFVVRDADGPGASEAPRALARMRVPLAFSCFYRVLDNQERRDALKTA